MNQLPVEVLEHIFINLISVDELASVRETCHYWKQVVDGSPTLMNRIDFAPPIRVMGRSGAPMCSIPARNVTLEDATILAVDSWLESTGHNVTSLVLKNCKISTETLVDLLENVPNLKFLHYACDSEVFDIETTCSLNKLEHFVCSAKAKILNLFGGMCPRLKHFQFCQQDEQMILGEFLRKVKDSLETVRLISVANILDDLMQLKQLISLEISSDSFDNETLTQIGAALPKLINLRITLRYQESEIMPTFLNSMRKLRYVSILGECSYIRINFCNLEKHNLRKLSLFRLSPLNLKEYLLKSSLFTDLTLRACVFYVRSDLYDVIQSLKSLERLDVGYPKIRFGRFVNIVSQSLNSLKYLRLSYLNIHRATLTSILEHCHNVEEVHLSNMEYILSENIIKDACCKWKRLKKLTIANISISDGTVEYIKSQCPQLRLINVAGCDKKL